MLNWNSYQEFLDYKKLKAVIFKRILPNLTL